MKLQQLISTISLISLGPVMPFHIHGLALCNSRYCQRAAGEITIQQSKRHGGLAVGSRRRLGVYCQVRVQTNARV